MSQLRETFRAKGDIPGQLELGYKTPLQVAPLWLSGRPLSLHDPSLYPSLKDLHEQSWFPIIINNLVSHLGVQSDNHCNGLKNETGMNLWK